MGCTEASVFLKIALVIFPIALILQIVGLATPNWSSVSATISGQTITQSNGLWAVCASSNGEKQCQNYDIVEDWVVACRAFAIIGMATVAAAAILEVLCTVALSKSSHKIAYILDVIIAFLGAGAVILACIIWAAKISDSGASAGLSLELSYSFGLSIAAGLLSGIGGILATIDLCKSS
ncbi:claudin-4-like [Argopecten irradians]|uniref:claudin-4-like n=1 Tax=Argopecten irradians TaxID=31199 RepID=UPI00371A1938